MLMILNSHPASRLARNYPPNRLYTRNLELIINVCCLFIRHVNQQIARLAIEELAKGFQGVCVKAPDLVVVPVANSCLTNTGDLLNIPIGIFSPFHCLFLGEQYFELALNSHVSLSLHTCPDCSIINQVSQRINAIYLTKIKDYGTIIVVNSTVDEEEDQMTRKIRKPKPLQKKSKSHEVSQTTANHFQVVSGTSGQIYDVRLTHNHTGATCSCKWGQYRNHGDPRSGCSHVQAALGFVKAQEGRTVSAWTSQKDAERQHRPILEIGDGVKITLRKAGT